MAEIENIHCPVCTQPIPSSWQNGLPPALATSVQRGEGEGGCPWPRQLHLLANREAQWGQHQGREGKSHGCAEGWVGWPYVTYCSSLFASGSVDSSLVQSVPGWAAMSLTSDSLFALVRWGAFIKILISLSRAP